MKFLINPLLGIIHFVFYILFFVIHSLICFVAFFWDFKLRNVTKLKFARRRFDGVIIITSPFVLSEYKTPFHILINKSL